MVRLRLMWKMPDRLPLPGESWDNVGSNLHRYDRPECLWKWSPERLIPRVSHKHCEGGTENADFDESGGNRGERQRARPERAEGTR